MLSVVARLKLFALTRICSEFLGTQRWVRGLTQRLRSAGPIPPHKTAGSALSSPNNRMLGRASSRIATIAVGGRASQQRIMKVAKEFPRHCKRSEAIQSFARELWIASSLPLLAMTTHRLIFSCRRHPAWCAARPVRRPPDRRRGRATRDLSRRPRGLSAFGSGSSSTCLRGA